MTLCLILAGPNGAGKSTVAPELVHGRFAVAEYVNADTIATGLAGKAPERVAMLAARLMVARLRELAEQGEPFAFETNLASRSHARFIRRLRADGYRVLMCFFMLPTAEHALARVRLRVAHGGHGVPPEVVRRRHHMGRKLFYTLYRDLVDSWWVYDGARTPKTLVAQGGQQMQTFVTDEAAWATFAAESFNQS